MAQQLTIMCPECGKETVINGKCINCGYVLWEYDPTKMKESIPKEKSVKEKPERLKCPHCGKESLINGFCRECGYEILGEKTKETLTKKDTPAESSEKHGISGLGVFLAVVFGIVVAVWIISKIFRVEITGTIIPLK